MTDFANIRRANRIVGQVALRIAQLAERAGKVRTTVDAYAEGVSGKIRAVAHPVAMRLVIEFPGATEDELVAKVLAEVEPDRARATVPASESRNPAWVVERRRTGAA